MHEALYNLKLFIKSNYACQVHQFSQNSPLILFWTYAGRGFQVSTADYYSRGSTFESRLGKEAAFTMFAAVKSGDPGGQVIGTDAFTNESRRCVAQMRCATWLIRVTL